MEAEPEQLHAVLAVEPSCRIVVVSGGDVGNQAYLVRPGACPAVVPRHGQAPQPSNYEINVAIGSLLRPAFCQIFSMKACPEKTSPTERTDRPPGPVSAALSDHRPGRVTVATTSQETTSTGPSGWGKKFLADWKQGTGTAAATAGAESAAPQSPQGDIGHMLSQRDSWPGLVRAMGNNGQLHRLVIGTAGNGNLYMTHPRRNLLILGPPRSEKTAGVLTPAILAHPGPVISTSTKADVLRATGLVRARLGRVWHYGPDGAETPPGALELRWSPIPASAKWSSAIALG